MVNAAINLSPKDAASSSLQYITENTNNTLDEEVAKKARLILAGTNSLNSANQSVSQAVANAYALQGTTTQAGQNNLLYTLQQSAAAYPQTAIQQTALQQAALQPAAAANTILLSSNQISPGASLIRAQGQAQQQLLIQSATPGISPAALSQPLLAKINSESSSSAPSTSAGVANGSLNPHMINSAGKPINAMTCVQKDTTQTKIFVGGLPYHTTDESLRKYFEAFGAIEEAVVISDRVTQKSRGYGFVTMVDPAAAARACADQNPIIDGRKANVNLAYIGAKQRVMPKAGIYRSLTPTFLPAQIGGINMFAAYGQQPATAYVTPNGVLIPGPTAAASPAQPIIDYGNAYAAQIPGGYAADAQTAAAVSASQYTASAHAAAFGGAAVHAPFAYPANYFSTPAAAYHPALQVPVPPMATTPTPAATYAAQMSVLQQQANDRI